LTTTVSINLLMEEVGYTSITPAGATITDGDVWIITTDTAVAELQDVADEILTYPSVVHFNGNDARGIEMTTDGGATWDAY